MHRLALAALFVSASALAQTTPSGVGPDNGFFRPTPAGDPSLTHPPAAAPIPPPAVNAIPVPMPAPYIPAPPVAPVDPIAVEAARAADLELERAEREALEAQARARAAPAPIPGAFTGLTSERDR